MKILNTIGTTAQVAENIIVKTGNVVDITMSGIEHMATMFERATAAMLAEQEEEAKQAMKLLKSKG